MSSHRRARKEAEQAEFEAEREETEAAEKVVVDYFDQVEDLTRAALLASGFHQHKAPVETPTRPKAKRLKPRRSRCRSLDTADGRAEILPRANDGEKKMRSASSARLWIETVVRVAIL